MHGLTPHEQTLAAINGGRRAEAVQGLVDLAVYLATHMDVPIPDQINVHYSVTAADDDAEFAAIDRIAGTIGEMPRIEHGGHYVVTREFGPVCYRAVAIPAASMNAYLALHSYEGAVQADSEVAA